MEVHSNGEEESREEKGCEEGYEESGKEEDGQKEEIEIWVQGMHERAIGYGWPSCVLEHDTFSSHMGWPRLSVAYAHAPHATHEDRWAYRWLIQRGQSSWVTPPAMVQGPAVSNVRCHLSVQSSWIPTLLEDESMNRILTPP